MLNKNGNMASTSIQSIDQYGIYLKYQSIYEWHNVMQDYAFRCTDVAFDHDLLLPASSTSQTFIFSSCLVHVSFYRLYYLIIDPNGSFLEIKGVFRTMILIAFLIYVILLFLFYFLCIHVCIINYIISIYTL